MLFGEGNGDFGEEGGGIGILADGEGDVMEIEHGGWMRFGMEDEQIWGDGKVGIFEYWGESGASVLTRGGQL